MVDWRSDDRELLARILTAEAGNQGPIGMTAAGNVIMNRANTPGYGDGVRGVIMKPGQFSPMNSVTGYARGEQGQNIDALRPTETAYMVADSLLQGTAGDITGGATHFFNPDISNPSWAQGEDFTRIGDHVFGRADAGRGTTQNTGATAMRQPTMTQGQPAPMPQEQQQPGGLRGLLSDPDFYDRLAIGLGGLTMNPNQQLMQMSADRISGRAQTRQDTAATNRTVEYLRSQGRDDLADAVASGSLGGRDAAKILFDGGPGQTEAFRTLEARAAAAGLTPGTPQYRDFMLQSAQQSGLSLTVGADGQVQVMSGPGVTGGAGVGAGVSQVGGLRQGEALVESDGDLSIVPIRGGATAQAADEAERQAFARDQQRARAASTVIQDLERARNLLPELGSLAQDEGVIGGISRTAQAGIPGTVANRITQFTESALSNVGLDTLQQMRENSPTGGALGQVPIQQQQRLEQVLGSLNINQPPSVLQANIERVMNIYTDIIYGSAAERARAVEEGRLTPEESAQIESFYYALPFDERGRPLQNEPSTAPQISDDELLQMYLGDN